MHADMGVGVEWVSDRLSVNFVVLVIPGGCVPVATPWVRPFTSRDLKKSIIELNLQERIL